VFAHVVATPSPDVLYVEETALGLDARGGAHIHDLDVQVAERLACMRC
jgi:hypothetical protein